VIKGHRLPLTGSRCYKQWLIGRRTKPTACALSVLHVAVMGKGCDGRREEVVIFPVEFFGVIKCRCLSAIDRR
jgi:hypothetical protein